MTQDTLKNNLNNLERKLVLLLDKYKNIKDEMAMLREENGELKAILRQKEEQLSSFQNQIKIGKIVNEIDSDGDAELKKKIDDYIKEIDKCLTHLSR